MTAPAQDDDRDGVAEAMGGPGADTAETAAADLDGDLAEDVAEALEGEGGTMPG